MAKPPNKASNDVILATLMDTIAKNQKFIQDTQKAIMALIAKVDPKITLAPRYIPPAVVVPKMDTPDIPPTVVNIEKADPIQIMHESHDWDVTVKRDGQGRIMSFSMTPNRTIN